MIESEEHSKSDDDDDDDDDDNIQKGFRRHINLTQSNVYFILLMFR